MVFTSHRCSARKNAGGRSLNRESLFTHPMTTESPASWRQLWYLPLLAIAMTATMLRVLVMARLLDVPSFGQYSAGLLVASLFGMLGCIGLYALLQRDMPMHFARGCSRRAMVLMGQCVGLTCIYGSLLMLTTNLPVTVAGLHGAVLAIALFNGFSQQLFLIATVESRSHGEPVRFAMQNLLRSLPLVAAGSLVAVLTGSPGWTLFVEALVSLIFATAIFMKALHRAKMGMVLLAYAAWRGWRNIPWASALPLLGISIVVTTLTLLDRWLGAELLQAEAFAQYAFAAIVVLIAQALQSMINALAYPSLARRFALSGSTQAFRLAAGLSLGLLALSAMASLPLYLAAEWAVEHWYEDYQQAIDLLPIMLAVAALRIADFWSSYATIAGKERRLLLFNLAGGLVSCIVWVSALFLGNDETLRSENFAWLALLLAFGLHATSAAVAQIARQRANSAIASNT